MARNRLFVSTNLDLIIFFAQVSAKMYWETELDEHGHLNELGGLNILKIPLCLFLLVAGDPAGDGHPGARAGASAAVFSLWEAHSASAH